MFGLVSMTAAVSSSIMDSSFFGSMRPRSSDCIWITLYPHKFAVAGLVPWAESGKITFFRCFPWDEWYAWIMSIPANSPCAPAAGCKLTCAIPLISLRYSCSSNISWRLPCDRVSGVYGWCCANPGREAVSLLTFGLYFIVQEPSG